MGNKIPYFFFFICILTCFSCEEDFLLERAAFKPKVVVNSVFTTDKPWIVHLSYSKDILENNTQILPILNAEVTIIEKSNGREILLKHVGEGKYISDIFPPQGDKNYELIALVPGYPKVSAISRAPKHNEVINIISTPVELEGEKTTKVDFEIKDNENNYYIWNLVFENKSNPIDTNFTGNPGNLVSSINKYSNISGYLNAISNPINNDAVSQGGQFTTYNQSILDNNDGAEESGETQTATTKKKYLRLLTVSKDLYNYYKSVEKFNTSENHNSSFSQSPDIYSNVQNGLGLFGGFTEKYTEIK